MLVVTSPVLTGYILGIAGRSGRCRSSSFGRRVRKLSSATQDRLADASALAGESLNAMPTVQSLYAGRLRVAAVSARRREGAFAAALRAHPRARGPDRAGHRAGVRRRGVRALAGRARRAGRRDDRRAALGNSSCTRSIAAGAVGALSRSLGRPAARGRRHRAAAATAGRAPAGGRSPPRRSRCRRRRTASRFERDRLSLSVAARDAGARRTFACWCGRASTSRWSGPSGAGKTTVFQLLLRFYDPQAGRDPRRRRRYARRRPCTNCAARIGVVPQDTVIFSGQRAGEHPLRPPRRQRRRGPRRRAEAAADEFIERAARGLSTPSSASAACGCPAASASASRSPAPS